MSEWLKEAVCKIVSESLHKFESCSAHQFENPSTLCVWDFLLQELAFLTANIPTGQYKGNFRVSNPPNSSIAPNSVWPPTPNADEAVLFTGSAYVDMRKAGFWVNVTAAIFGLVLACGAALRLQSNMTLESHALALGLYGMLYFVCLLLQAVFFLIWVHGVHRNLCAFQAKGTGSSPGWAVVYFFIPIVNLFRPYFDMSDAWRASDPKVDAQDRTAWLRSDGSGIMKIWWFLFVAWLILGDASNAIRRSGSEANATSIEVACATVGIFGLFAMSRVVTLMNDRQAAKEAALLRSEQAAG